MLDDEIDSQKPLPWNYPGEVTPHRRHQEAQREMTHEEYVKELNALALLMRAEDDKWRVLNKKEPLGPDAYAKDFDMAKVAMTYYGRTR